jgi:hypothetical protein
MCGCGRGRGPGSIDQVVVVFQHGGRGAGRRRHMISLGSTVIIVQADARLKLVHRAVQLCPHSLIYPF